MSASRGTKPKARRAASRVSVKPTDFGPLSASRQRALNRLTVTAGKSLRPRALFSGSDGKAKDAAAAFLARALGLALFRIDLRAVIAKYIGETEKNLRRLFDRAEASGAILLIDEADALFGKRTQVKDSHDRYANMEISYLLARIERYRGLVILSCNRRPNVDPTFPPKKPFRLSFARPKRRPAKRKRRAA
jgi:SpoVK/Ycf46/Vps4 family AAA+-type ATPase